MSGHASKQSGSNLVTCKFVSTSSHFSKPQVDVPAADINRFWELENEVFDRAEISVLDKNVIDLWDNECRKVYGHYELPIPWKNPEEELLDNSVIAHKWLDNLVRHLHYDGLYEIYDQEINKLLDANYAELLPSESLQNTTNVWYLLHHCIQTCNLSVSLTSCMLFSIAPRITITVL